MGSKARQPKWCKRRPQRVRGSRQARRQARALGNELAADCEALLLCSYADRLDARRVPVPVWAWTNLLAHGSQGDLRIQAGSVGAGSAASRSWREARAYLATEILEKLGRGASLDELQRQVLGPLELRLSSRGDVLLWNPQRWVATVRATLSTYQQSRRS
jgi:hypothetical protein